MEILSPLTDKELKRADHDALTNPVMRKLLFHYNLKQEDVFLDFHHTILLKIKQFTEKMKNDSLSLENDNDKAVFEVFKSLGTISTGLTKLETVSRTTEVTEASNELSIDKVRNAISGPKREVEGDS